MKKYPEPIVGALIVNDNGEILVIRSPKWESDYSISGGHVELGETIEDAVKREVKEEVGLDIKLKEVLFVQEAIYPKEFHKKKHFIFLECVCRTKSSEIKMDDREITGYLWIKPEKALKLNLDGYTKKFIVKYLEKYFHRTIKSLK
jgi:nucleoside triphosphatase